MKGIILTEEQWLYVLDILQERQEEALDEDASDYDMCSDCCKAIIAALYSKTTFPEV